MFVLLLVTGNPIMNILTCAYISGGYVPNGRISRSQSMYIFNVSKNTYCEVIVSIYTPNTRGWESQCSTYSLTIDILTFLRLFLRSGGCVVLASVSIFLNAHKVEQIFLGLLDTGYFPLRAATKDFAHFSMSYLSHQLMIAL